MGAQIDPTLWDLPLSDEPFLWEGSSDRACLLLHGLGGGVYQLRWLAQYLHQQGLTVQGINFPGHGIPVEEMPPSVWPQWYEHSRLAYEQLIERYGRVSLLGFSTGCVVALYLAHQMAAQQRAPERLVLLSPFMAIKRLWFTGLPLEVYVKALGGIVKQVPRRRLAIGDPKIRMRAETVDRTRTFNLISVQSAVQLIERVKTLLPEITIPTLMIQSTQDSVVDPPGAQYLYDQLGSEAKVLHWLHNSDHIIQMDREREQVFEWVGSFF